MEENTRRTREVLSGIIGMWSQAKTTGEVRSRTDTWRCERSSIVVMVLGKLFVWIFVKLYVWLQGHRSNNDVVFR